LRRVVRTKTSSSETTMNTNISVILEKANSIRQVPYIIHIYNLTFQFASTILVIKALTFRTCYIRL